MDGKFVPSKSITPEDIEKAVFPIGSEAHLMVEDVSLWLPCFKKFGSNRIIYHFEINKDHKEIISQIRGYGFNVGLAVNPSTTLEEFKDLVNLVDMVLFMSVMPGFYGSAFVLEVLTKIKEFKQLFPQKKIGIDGGIKLDNVKAVANLGIDYICVGSALLKSNNLKESYCTFKNMINE